MTRQEKIDKFLAEPLKVGDLIYVQGLGSQSKKSWFNSTEVTRVKEGIPYIKEHSTERKVTEQWKKSTRHIGATPFATKFDNIRNLNFTLESILWNLFKDKDKYDIEGVEIENANFNPFVLIGGEKKYYQRPLVWDLKSKQLLIDSIYNGVDCGKVLIRNRSWEELRVLKQKGYELAWRDVVDGKQRLNAVQDFILGKFKDSMGNYFEDLTDNSQNRLTNHQLFSYSELPEDSSDKEVLSQFLLLNFAGVPQSEEHLNFVKTLL